VASKYKAASIVKVYLFFLSNIDSLQSFGI